MKSLRPLARACSSIALAALVACGSSTPTPRDASKDSVATTSSHAVDSPYFPGFGAIDGARRVAAFAGNGVLTLVSLSDGAHLWSNTDAWFVAALVVDGDRVYAAERANDHALDVATVDGKSGKIVARSQPLVLPDWAPITPRGGAEMTVSGRIDDHGALIVHWTSSTSYWGGVAPSPEMVAASTHHAEGAARIDLATGALAPLSDDETKHEGELQSHAPPALGALPAELPAEAKYGDPVILGDRLYYVTGTPMTSASSSTDTVLHAFDMEHHVALWSTVVRRDPVFMPPP